MGRHLLSELELVGMSYSDYSEEEVRRDRAYEKWLKTRPICDYCENPIEDEEAYTIDGKTICEGCIEEYLEEYHRLYIRD